MDGIFSMGKEEKSDGNNPLLLCAAQRGGLYFFADPAPRPFLSQAMNNTNKNEKQEIENNSLHWCRIFRVSLDPIFLALFRFEFGVVSVNGCFMCRVDVRSFRWILLAEEKDLRVV